MREILANHIPDKDLLFRIYKDPLQLNNPIKKWLKNENRPFSKEDTQMTKKHMRRHSTHYSLGKCKSRTPCDGHILG
jgi:hypothetical protein